MCWKDVVFVAASWARTPFRNTLQVMEKEGEEEEEKEKEEKEEEENEEKLQWI